MSPMSPMSPISPMSPTLQYIRLHAADDVRQLALHPQAGDDVDVQFALQQIAGRQRASAKLPTWAATDDIIFPPQLSLEQCSSEATARYKRQLVERLGVSSTFVDLTGGFGVDFAMMAPCFSKAVYVERQEELAALARHNFGVLGLCQAEVVCADAEDYLRSMEHASLIFVDPARRDSHGARTYGISDCTPDVVSLRLLLVEKADSVLLKLSPMLDWRKAVSDIGSEYVREVHIVSVGNECKELLLLIGQGRGMRLFCVNDEETYETHETHETHKPHEPHEPHKPHKPHKVAPGSFLYEPNTSVMKAGCFEELAARFGVSQIAANSHLFTSTPLATGFPGRTFVIDKVTSLNKRELKASLNGVSKANIAVRNFPLSVAELRKRLKISEGGSIYIFATTLASGNHILLICHKPTA